MKLLRMVAKTVAALVGLPLTLAGFGGFWYGFYMAFGEQNIAGGIFVSVGSVFALTIGTILGKFAAGEYD